MTQQTAQQSKLQIEYLVDQPPKYTYDDKVSDAFRKVLEGHDCDLVSWSPINSSDVHYPKDLNETKPQIYLAVFYEPKEKGKFPMRRQHIYSSSTQFDQQTIDSLAEELKIKIQHGLDQQEFNKKYPQLMSGPIQQSKRF